MQRAAHSASASKGGDAKGKARAEEQSCGELDRLGSELVLKVLKMLPLKDVARAGLVCKALRAHVDTLLLRVGGMLEGEAMQRLLQRVQRVGRTLQHLVLGGCWMGDEGAQALAEALRGNTTLETSII